MRRRLRSYSLYSPLFRFAGLTTIEHQADTRPSPPGQFAAANGHIMVDRQLERVWNVDTIRHENTCAGVRNIENRARDGALPFRKEDPSGTEDQAPFASSVVDHRGSSSARKGHIALRSQHLLHLSGGSGLAHLEETHHTLRRVARNLGVLIEIDGRVRLGAPSRLA